MFSGGLGAVLAPIQSYCQARNLPPLMVLVVQKETGLPSTGFTAAQAMQVATDQSKVFDFDWLKHGNPQVTGFQQKTAPTIDEAWPPAN